ncbi:MAG: NERD domain-containing protein [Pseudomonadota bacterium]
MTIVEGQIETLKQLKQCLRDNGITRFNSVGELTRFQKGFENEKRLLPELAQQTVTEEIEEAQAALMRARETHNELCERVRAEEEQPIHQLKAGMERASKKVSERSVFRLFFSFRVSRLSKKIARLERNLDKTVEIRTKRSRQAVARQRVDVEVLEKDKESLVSQRYEQALTKLNRTKEVVDNLSRLIAGAIGETSVIRALEVLPNEYFLINDFSVKFHPSIYNKAKGDRIYSVQVDHVLIGRSGVFLLETKNWSKASIHSLDLRSPVEQVKRTSFALFALLNGDVGRESLALAQHHWGDKRIPIRNVIVMTNAKPREEFKFVKILSLKELVGYVRYFDQTFSADEARRIFEFLREQASLTTA